MNIKVAACTVSEKSSNIHKYWITHWLLQIIWGMFTFVIKLYGREWGISKKIPIEEGEAIHYNCLMWRLGHNYLELNAKYSNSVSSYYNL